MANTDDPHAAHFVGALLRTGRKLTELGAFRFALIHPNSQQTQRKHYELLVNRMSQEFHVTLHFGLSMRRRQAV